MKRFLRSRRLWFAVFAYCALWAATYVIGGRQVREITLADLGIQPSYHRIGFDASGIYEFPAYGYTVVSYAPFFVTARYVVWWQDEAAAGGTSIYFWFAVPSRPFKISDWRV